MTGIMSFIATPYIFYIHFGAWGRAYDRPIDKQVIFYGKNCDWHIGRWQASSI